MRNNLPQNSNNKATVCYKNTCATVEGETARFVNAVAAFAAIVVAAGLLVKFFKSL